jgi:hypothetical protein
MASVASFEPSVRTGESAYEEQIELCTANLHVKSLRLLRRDHPRFDVVMCLSTLHLQGIRP